MITMHTAWFILESELLSISFLVLLIKRSDSLFLSSLYFLSELFLSCPSRDPFLRRLLSKFLSLISTLSRLWSWEFRESIEEFHLSTWRSVSSMTTSSKLRSASWPWVLGWLVFSIHCVRCKTLKMKHIGHHHFLNQCSIHLEVAISYS